MVQSNWRGAEALARVRAAAWEGLVEAAEEVFTEATLRVPRDTEQLVESGQMVPFPDQLLVVLSFGDDTVRHGNEVPASEYAVQQHEDMTIRHDDGEAKFLEGPLKEAEASGLLERAVGAAVGRALP